mgnify:CR=1 FL=1
MSAAEVHRWAGILALSALLAGCALPLSNNSPETALNGELSLEDRYAGEVLAYMMRVVLGRAGPLARREAWQRQGLGQPLDLGRIAATMDDPQRPKSDLLVVDAALIGLSEVLYDYNPRLNLFKGRYAFHSPYPSAELIALRLLLLGKLDRGETLRFSALMRNEAELVSRGAGLPVGRLAEMGLSPQEAALLQAVFRSEPAFRWYYKSPPLVAAMDAMGLLVPETAVVRRVGDYRYAAWHKPGAGSGASIVRIAVLPSLVPGFRGDGGGFQAPEDYLKAGRALERKLRLAVDRKLSHRSLAAASERLEIDLHLERPYVLHPLNLDHHLESLCPDADLVVLVLGRNVYRSIAMDAGGALPDGPPRWYLDLLDLKYGHSGDDIDEIASAATRLLAHPMLAPVTQYPSGPASRQ